MVSHKVAFRKLGRPTGHRMLMLRNLVSDLIEHEHIKTTLPKAKETARLAEKVITWGKKGLRQHKSLANAFLLKPATTHSKVFTELAKRYSTRPGGYTRLHLYGHRAGDHAPSAILELVDSPQDLKHAATAMAVGRELASKAISTGLVPTKAILGNEKAFLAATWRSTSVDELEMDAEGLPRAFSLLREGTRQNVNKVLAFRKGEVGSPLAEFNELAIQAFDRTLAQHREGNVYVPDEDKAARLHEWNVKATPRRNQDEAIKPPVIVPTLRRPTRAGEKRTDSIEKDTAWSRAMGEQRVIKRRVPLAKRIRIASRPAVQQNDAL